MSRGWLVQVVCDGIALGRSVVYATQLRGSGRLIVVGCVQWQLRHYQAGGSTWVGRSKREMAALAPARLAFGRLSAIIETPRLVGLQGWDRSGGWLEQVVYATQLHQASRCICDTIAWW